MNKRLAVAVSLASLLTVVLVPAAAQAVPAWCKSAGDSISPSAPDRVLKEQDPGRAVWEIVAFLCFPDKDYAASTGKIEELRQAWSKKLDLIDEDWADAAEWATTGRSNSAPTMYPKDEKAPWSKYSPIDQYAALDPTSAHSVRVKADALYFVDALGPRLSALGRMAFVMKCLRWDTPAAWAICQGDIDQLDWKQIAADIRGDKTHDATRRFAIRLKAYELRSSLPGHADKVKALQAKDPAYARMFEIGAATRKEWAGKVDPKLLDLASSMDDARATNSRRASEGCMERAWEAWSSMVAAIPAKQYATTPPDPDFKEHAVFQGAMGMVIDTPNGYLATVSLVICTKLTVQKEDYIARTLGSLLVRWPGYRGPRTATHMGIVHANIQLDDRDATIEYPPHYRDWLGFHPGSSGGGRGEIARVQVSGDTARIEFQKVKTKQTECVKGRYTNRVQQIRSDGTLVYQYVCEKSKTVTINEPPFNPQTVNARYAKGLKKGMFISVVEDTIIIAYPKGNATVPAMIAGVPVK